MNLHRQKHPCALESSCLIWYNKENIHKKGMVKSMDFFMIYVVIPIVSGLIWGFATAEVRDKKGYGRNWFWFGFFLGLVPFIIACAIPAKKPDAFESYTPGELKRLMDANGAGQAGQSQFAQEDYVQSTVAAGGWQCSCGRANAAYASTCACGMNKRQLGTSDSGYAVKANQWAEQQQALDAELRKYAMMLDSQVISQAEYDAKVKELLLRR